MTMTVVDEGRAGTSSGTAEGAGGSPRRAGLLRRVLKNEVARFAAGGLLAALLVGAGTFVVVSRDAEDQAIQHAKDITQVEATGIVQPALSDSLLARDPAAIGALDTIVRQRILSSDVVRVKLWTADGTVIYSDERRLIGRDFDLDGAELAALHGGAVDAGVSDLTDAENQYERSFGKLLQVYLPVHTPDGTPLLFETYQRYEAISQYQQSVWSSFLPVLLVGLAHPLRRADPPRRGHGAAPARLAGRAPGAARARHQRLRAGAPADRPRPPRRRRAAPGGGDLLAERAGPAADLRRRVAAPAADVPDVEHAAGETRAAMRDLRTLIVEIAPPNLHAEGIDNALRDLLEPLAANGVAVSLDAPHDTALSAATTTSSSASPRRRCATPASTPAPPTSTCACTTAATTSASRSTTTGAASAPPTWRAGAATATSASACSATSSPTPAARCASSLRAAAGEPASRSRCPADGRAHPPAHRRRPPPGAARALRALRRGERHRGRRRRRRRRGGGRASRWRSSPTWCSWTSPCRAWTASRRPGGCSPIRPEARVVMLTSFADHERVMEALDSGAVGYILKDAESDELLRGVRAAAGGDSPLSPRAARALITARRGRRPFEELTGRELDVLKLVARGLSNKQIAWRLAISEKTVKAHMTSIFGRIGVADRTQAALWAQRHGVV